MKRERFAWVVSVILLAMLAVRLPGSLAQRDDDYAFVRTLVDIHRQVANNYVEPVDEPRLREKAIEGMLEELDPFTTYVPASRQEDFERMLEGSFKGVGIQLDQQSTTGPIEVVTPIEGSPAFKAGVKPGDVILKVNGESVEGLRVQEAIKKITGPIGTEVKLTVRHVTGEVAELSMTREEIIVPVIKGFVRKADDSWDYYVVDDPKVAYLRITQFTSDTAGKLREALVNLHNDGMRGLILDLRFNPGGRLEEAIEVVDLFIKEGAIVSTRGRNRAERPYVASDGGTLPDFPMIVLVNEHSASASEIVAGSLLDNKRALIIGERTYGKGSVQEVIPLDSKGGELKMTVAYYYLPSGRLVHRKKDATDWGVNPQVSVPLEGDAETKAFQEMSERDRFLKPNGPATAPAPGVAAATSQPALDAQLQRAVDTMIGLIVLKGDRQAQAPFQNLISSAIPATQPAGARPAE